MPRTIHEQASYHFPLNAYLHRFKRSDSASCPACGFHTENAQHFLLDCPAYAHERWALTRKRSPTDTDFAKIITNPKTAVQVATFIQETGRVTQEGRWKRSNEEEGEARRGSNNITHQ